MINKLPDTPWHLGYAKKEESDPRRHKGRCIFYTKTHCTNGKSGCFMQKCGGSSHCIYYAESAQQWEKVYEQTKTIEDIKREKRAPVQKRQQQYKERWVKKASDLLRKDRFAFHQRRINHVRKCLVCEAKLQVKNNIKICPYCNAMFAPDYPEYRAMQNVFILTAEEAPIKKKQVKKPEPKEKQLIIKEKRHIAINAKDLRIKEQF